MNSRVVSRRRAPILAGVTGPVVAVPLPASGHDDSRTRGLGPYAGSLVTCAPPYVPTRRVP